MDFDIDLKSGQAGDKANKTFCARAALNQPKCSFLIH